MKLRLLILVAIVSTIWLVGCGDGVTREGVTLEDTTWVLKSYGEPGNMKTVLAGTETTATFKSDTGQVVGSAECNSYGGDYQLSGNELSIIPGSLVTTTLSCGEQIDDQEQQYLSALHAAENYIIENGKLTINCGSTILNFKQK